MKLNSEKLNTILNEYGIDVKQIDINADNIAILDDLPLLKERNVSVDSIIKLFSLSKEQYDIALSYIEVIPDFKLDSLLDPSIESSKMDGFFRIAKYNHEAEFGTLKDRGKTILSNDDMINLIEIHHLLSTPKISMIANAIFEDLDYKKITNQAINLSDGKLYEDIVRQREIKAEVISQLSQNSLIKDYGLSNIKPDFIKHLCKNFNDQKFNITKEILDYGNVVLPKHQNINSIPKEINNTNQSKEFVSNSIQANLNKLMSQIEGNALSNKKSASELKSDQTSNETLISKSSKEENNKNEIIEEAKQSSLEVQIEQNDENIKKSIKR